MPQRRLLIAGAKGGQGTTTIATVVAALAASRGPTTLVSTRPDDVCALTGVPVPSTGPSMASISDNLRLLGAESAHRHDASGVLPAQSGDATQYLVADLGCLNEFREHHALETHSVADTTRWLVVRGPCYLSLRVAIHHPWEPQGIIVLAEAGRPLTSADVSDVLGAPVIAQVPIEATVARIIDAGLLLARLPALSRFQSLSRLLPPPVPAEDVPAA